MSLDPNERPTVDGRVVPESMIVQGGPEGGLRLRVVEDGQPFEVPPEMVVFDEALDEFRVRRVAFVFDGQEIQIPESMIYIDPQSRRAELRLKVDDHEVPTPLLVPNRDDPTHPIGVKLTVDGDPVVVPPSMVAWDAEVKRHRVRRVPVALGGRDVELPATMVAHDEESGRPVPRLLVAGEPVPSGSLALDPSDGLLKVRLDVDGQFILVPPKQVARDPESGRLGIREIKLRIDGEDVKVPEFRVARDPGLKATKLMPTTIYDAAKRAGVDVPVLCHREHMTPAAVCRVCTVELKGSPKLIPACHRQVESGMEVSTHETSPRVRAAVRVLGELLMSDHPTPCEKQERDQSCELEALAGRFDARPGRFAKTRGERGQDDSSVVIAVNHDACILCDRCVRGCNEIRDNQVIGRARKGYNTRIAFDLDDPMGDSTCVACGECMISCPTGALTHRGLVVPEFEKIKKKSGVEKVGAADLADHPLFRGVSRPFLGWNEGAIVRRHYKKGDIICREGEFGSTAFYIEEGQVEIFLESSIQHVKSRKGRDAKTGWGPFGLIQKFVSVLVPRDQDDREGENRSRYIPIDAPVALRYDDPIATLEAGDVFGEMSCMNNYPRSATVRAAGDVVVLEMLRNVLYILQRNEASRSMLEARYFSRAIESHLLSVDIFSKLADDDPAAYSRLIDRLRVHARLLRLNPGEVIFRQGDAADAFYLVRIGHVKVAQENQGSEHVLAYIGPGGFFGEIGLMAHVPEVRDLAPRGVRTATCSALDHLDLVRIDATEFLAILEEFPSVRSELIAWAVDRLHENEEARRRIQGTSLAEFLDQGLQEAQSLLVLDLEKCTRCDECTKACADSHDGVTRLIREGLRFDKFLVASSCRSCLDPYCMVGCPVGSIRRRQSREIIIEDWCIGCGKCAENCPYGNINMHPFPVKRDDPENPGKKVAVVQQKATTCDLCSSLDGQPSCVYACPHDAAHRMAGSDLLTLVNAAGPR